MALATGEGSEIRAPLAITVIGGLTVSTLLTMIIIPLLYSLVEKDKVSSPATVVEPIESDAPMGTPAEAHS
jgi:HAE1 family hydrophobic/amphiphilic exporter-1